MCSLGIGYCYVKRIETLLYAFNINVLLLLLLLLHVKTHSLFFPIDIRFEHGTVELASMNMVELASLNSVVGRLVHACWHILFAA